MFIWFCSIQCCILLKHASQSERDKFQTHSFANLQLGILVLYDCPLEIINMMIKTTPRNLRPASRTGELQSVISQVNVTFWTPFDEKSLMTSSRMETHNH